MLSWVEDEKSFNNLGARSQKLSSSEKNLEKHGDAPIQLTISFPDYVFQTKFLDDCSGLQSEYSAWRTKNQL